MPRPEWVRSSVSISLGKAILAVGAASVAFAGVELACLEWDRGTEIVAADALQIGCGLVYVATGLAAWWRRPSNSLGLLMVCCGWAFLLQTLYVVPSTAALTVSIILNSLPLPVIAHIVLAFPSGRLGDRPTRWLIGYAYFITLAFTVPQYMYLDTDTPLRVRVDPGRADFWQGVTSWTAAIGVAAFCVLIVRRLRATTPTKRRVLLPLYLYGVVGLVAAVFVATHPGLPASANPIGREVALFAWLALVPVVFALALLRGGFARTAAVEELGGWLGAESGSRPELQDGLAATLGDDSAQLLFWDETRNQLMDGAGHAVDVDPLPDGRGIFFITIRERRVGAIVYDTSLIADDSDVGAAGRVLALAVDRDRLNAELRASEEELRRSRARIAATGQQERRRVAEQLHDEMQNRVVLIGLGIQLVISDSEVSDEVRQRLERLREDAAELANRVRAIAYEIMPPQLIERGLRAALEELCDRVPTRVRLRYDEPPGLGRLPDSVESLAYYVAAEAATNAAKHANAENLSIDVIDAGTSLQLGVRDDGIGGAVSTVGRGLANLTDRVRALGGNLRIGNAPEGGTVVLLDLPVPERDPSDDDRPETDRPWLSLNAPRHG
jgi:signal transduction histidine kinase